MKKLVILLLVLVVAVGALGYWRGWFSVTKQGKVDVQFDSVKFNQDKSDFSKTVGEKTRALKVKIADLWKKTEGLTGDDQAEAKKELAALEKKHERIEKQLKELEETGADKFESTKQDLTKALDEVEQKIEELTKKLEKVKDK